jgi:acyl-CoA thioester hydrolase
VERVGTSSVRYRLGAFAKGAAAPSAEGHFTHVYVDRESRRPKPLSDGWRDKLSEIADQSPSP